MGIFIYAKAAETGFEPKKEVLGGKIVSSYQGTGSSYARKGNSEALRGNQKGCPLRSARLSTALYYKS